VCFEKVKCFKRASLVFVLKQVVELSNPMQLTFIHSIYENFNLDSVVEKR